MEPTAWWTRGRCLGFLGPDQLQEVGAAHAWIPSDDPEELGRHGLLGQEHRTGACDEAVPRATPKLKDVFGIAAWIVTVVRLGRKTGRRLGPTAFGLRPLGVQRGEVVLALARRFETRLPQRGDDIGPIAHHAMLKSPQNMWRAPEFRLDLHLVGFDENFARFARLRYDRLVIRPWPSFGLSGDDGIFGYFGAASRSNPVQVIVRPK